MSTDLTAEEQTAILADRYSERAEGYDALWSPIIRPAGERLIQRLALSSRTTSVIDVGAGAGALVPAIEQAAPGALIVGVDRSLGMLRLAKGKHAVPLAVMDAQKLALSANRFDAAVVAFMLFHLPSPEQCLVEVARVLRSGGALGTITWGSEDLPMANGIWEEELKEAGAQVSVLPAVDNRACCDSIEKMTDLLEGAGFASIKVWSESIEHRWRPEDHFEYHLRMTSRVGLQSLSAGGRDVCLRRVRERLTGADDQQYVYWGEVLMATGIKQDV